MNNLRLTLGGPGCGKTTRLLQIVKEEIASGVPASAIAFVTFTKAAATEAKERAAKAFGLDLEKDLPWFRTIHSLTYAQLGVNRDEMMEGRDWREFSEIAGETITGITNLEEGVPGGGRETGDVLLRITDYASTTCTGLVDAWHALDDPVDWYRLKRFAATLNAYKDDCGKMDFTDLLHRYVQDGTPVPVQVAVIDEAQDLTAAQWKAVRHAFSTAERVYVGGDDDQAIYHWAGADVQQFLTLSTTPEVLSVSHRLPRQIHALSQRIARRISKRYAKAFAPSDRDGVVEWHQYPQSVNLSDGTWFLLARNNYQLRPLEAMVRELGFPYNRRYGPAISPVDVRAMQLWERLRSGKQADMSAAEYRALAKILDLPKPQVRELERYTIAQLGLTEEHQRQPWFEALPGIPPERRDYYLSCLRRGEKLTNPARITLDTIHGAKGKERQHVMLLTDMSERTAKSYALNADTEHRVFYVGVTRAEQSLHLIAPQSDRAYPIY